MSTTHQPTPGKSKSEKPSKKADAPVPLNEQVVAYFKGVRSEWGKISWPTWPQIWGQTIVVLVMTSIMTLGLFIMDNVFHLLVQLITPHRS
jgi:preprotein translocase subunit SecE